MARYQELNFKFQTWYLEFLLLASRSPSGAPPDGCSEIIRKIFRNDDELLINADHSRWLEARPGGRKPGKGQGALRREARGGRSQVPGSHNEAPAALALDSRAPCPGPGPAALQSLGFVFWRLLGVNRGYY